MKQNGIIKIFVAGLDPIQTYSNEVHNILGNLKHWPRLKIFNPSSAVHDLEKYTKDIIIQHSPKFLTIMGYGVGALYGYKVAAITGSRFIGINPIMNPTSKSIRNQKPESEVFCDCYINPQLRHNQCKAIYDNTYKYNENLNIYFDEVVEIKRS